MIENMMTMTQAVWLNRFQYCHLSNPSLGLQGHKHIYEEIPTLSLKYKHKTSINKIMLNKIQATRTWVKIFPLKYKYKRKHKHTHKLKYKEKHKFKCID